MDGGSPARREEVGVQGSTRGCRYGRDEASGAYRGACWMRALPASPARPSAEPAVRCRVAAGTRRVAGSQ